MAKAFSIFDIHEAMDLEATAASILAIDPFLHCRQEDFHRIRHATLCKGEIKTLATLCCFIRERPPTKPIELIKRTLREFILNHGKHLGDDGFRRVLNQDWEAFESYCKEVGSHVVKVDRK